MTVVTAACDISRVRWVQQTGHFKGVFLANEGDYTLSVWGVGFWSVRGPNGVLCAEKHEQDVPTAKRCAQAAFFGLQAIDEALEEAREA